MTARQHLDDAARRARLVARHHLGRTAASVEEAVRDVLVLHSSDPITPPLALWARVPGVTVAAFDRAVYTDRTLWRLHAMRRTLFVVLVADAPMFLAACSRDVARAERRKLERWVVDALPDDRDAGGWLDEMGSMAVAALADGRTRSTKELSDMVDGLDLRVAIGSGKWAGTTPLSSRLLFLLALDARIIRAEPAGSWISSQYRWADPQAWFGDPVRSEDLASSEARAALVRAYLRAHGPATTVDVTWWTGWGKRVTAAAIAASGAAEVDLDGGGAGWVLPEDLDRPGVPAAGIALLPTLDPTVMGWKERAWYLGGHAPRLFDTNGNAGPTVWADGRVVGGWALSAAGEVVTQLLDDIGAEHVAAIDAEAAALTGWLAGVSPTPRFRTPLERELSV
jgi:hypothetical protein